MSIASVSSIRVLERSRFSTLFRADDLKAFINALSTAAQTKANDGLSPAVSTFSVQAKEVHGLGSIIGVDDSMGAHGALTDSHVEGNSDQLGVLDDAYGPADNFALGGAHHAVVSHFVFQLWMLCGVANPQALLD